MPALIQMLNSPRVEDQIESLRALGRIGPDAREAVPALIGLLRTSTDWMRVVTIETLAAIRPESKQPSALIEALDDPADPIRGECSLPSERLAPTRRTPSRR